MKISAIAPWYGSKRTLAPLIIEQLGPHSCYWEPFAGSCSVLLAKPPATYESVNDLHGDWFNLCLVLKDDGMAKDLYARAYRTLFHESILPAAKGSLRLPAPKSPNVARAETYLSFSWMSLNGVSGTPLHNTGTFAARYSAKGGNGATRWRSMVESIPDWHERLRGVQILNRDAFVVLESLDDAIGTAIYVDPPYIEKGAKYVHDFKPEDHDRLAETLRRFKKARVVVSYYENPRLKDLYRGWTKVKCYVAKSMVNGGMRDKKGAQEAPEIMLINGPSLAKVKTPEMELFT
jgi:DNA adenine methylase